MKRTVPIIALLFITVSLLAVTIRKDGSFFRLTNTHLYHLQKIAPADEKLFVCKDRDLVLIPVKSPSNLFLSTKNPSFLQKNQKITIKINGKQIDGKIIGLSRGFFETDINFAPGDSGTVVFDSRTKRPIGLLSHYITVQKTKHFFAVRFDNLDEQCFEMLSHAELIADLEIFYRMKNAENTLLQAVRNSMSKEEIKAYLNKNEHKIPDNIRCRSVYLQNECLKSQNIIKNIHLRFLK